jgi:hypothetical protein
MPGQIQKGTLYDAGDYRLVTPENLNAHVDNAKLLVGSITEQIELVGEVKSDDKILIADASTGGLRQTGIQNVMNSSLNLTVGKLTLDQFDGSEPSEYTSGLITTPLSTPGEISIIPESVEDVVTGKWKGGNVRIAWSQDGANNSGWWEGPINPTDINLLSSTWPSWLIEGEHETSGPTVLVDSKLVVNGVLYAGNPVQTGPAAFFNNGRSIVLPNSSDSNWAGERFDHEFRYNHVKQRLEVFVPSEAGTYESPEGHTFGNPQPTYEGEWLSFSNSKETNKYYKRFFIEDFTTETIADGGTNYRRQKIITPEPLGYGFRQCKVQLPPGINVRISNADNAGTMRHWIYLIAFKDGQNERHVLGGWRQNPGATVNGVNLFVPPDFQILTPSNIDLTEYKLMVYWGGRHDWATDISRKDAYSGDVIVEGVGPLESDVIDTTWTSSVFLAGTDNESVPSTYGHEIYMLNNANGSISLPSGRALINMHKRIN